MKKSIIVLLYLFIANTLIAQIPIKLYYNSQFNVTRKSEAKFYREAFIDTSKYIFEGKFSDYTVDNIKILSGNYRDGLKNGEFIIYNLQGKVYAKGNFKNDSLEGIWKYFYPNGQVKAILEFYKSDFKIHGFFNQNGKNQIPNGTGKFQFDFINNFENNSKLHLKGTLLDSMKVKKWIIYDGREKLAYDIYEKNIFKSSKRYSYSSSNLNHIKVVNNELFVPLRLFKTDTIIMANDNLSIHDYPLLKYLPQYESINAVGILGDSVIYNLDSLPEFIGGIDKIGEFISKNIKYPIAAMEKGITGKVYMEIIIDEKGNVVKASPARESNKILEKEAERVLLLLTNFKPGYYKDRYIKTKFVYPITFNSTIFN